MLIDVHKLYFEDIIIKDSLFFNVIMQGSFLQSQLF